MLLKPRQSFLKQDLQAFVLNVSRALMMVLFLSDGVRSIFLLLLLIKFLRIYRLIKEVIVWFLFLQLFQGLPLLKHEINQILYTHLLRISLLFRFLGPKIHSLATIRCPALNTLEARGALHYTTAPGCPRVQPREPTGTLLLLFCLVHEVVLSLPGFATNRNLVQLCEIGLGTNVLSELDSFFEFVLFESQMLLVFLPEMQALIGILCLPQWIVIGVLVDEPKWVIGPLFRYGLHINHAILVVFGSMLPFNNCQVGPDEVVFHFV